MMAAVGTRNDERDGVGQSASYAIAHGTRALGRQRLLVHRSGAGWPYVWRGLLPSLGLALLGLYAMGPFARHEIEDSVRRSVSQALVAKGLPGVEVSVSGQQVLLTGQLAPGFNSLDALAIAREATCPTWIGPQPCAELVVGQFVTPPALPAATPAPPSAAPTPGAVPAQSVAAAAEPAAARHQACERALAAVVERERIEFEAGSARLTAGSARVLDAVAQAHAGCSGIVRIEGHTDDRGNPDGNRRLSLARAQAVRDALVRRGIAADRLLAEGLGDSRPVADNSTPEGRRHNRRIEFKVVVSP